MKSFCPLVFLLVLLTGCASEVYTYDRQTGKWSVEHFTKWGGDPVFLSQLDDGVKSESENIPPTFGTWRENWIDQCERLHYYEKPDLADHYIEYIINKRAEAGLPDIPEIDRRQFRSLWENWTSSINEQLALEAEGHPPLLMFSVEQKRMTKTWPEYWKALETNLLNDPLVIDRDIVANGAEYISTQRKKMGLRPLE
jgi:hypothetical protein